MMKKLLVKTCGFFATLSVLSIAGILKTGFIHEPKPPHMREE